jgi:hypothetical protein
MPRNELVERSVKYVAHVQRIDDTVGIAQRIDDTVGIARDPLAQSARENLNQSVAMGLGAGQIERNT